jgi:SnoaL-like domain
LIQDELFDDNAKSIEPDHSNWENVEGLDKNKAKAKQ